MQVQRELIAIPSVKASEFPGDLASHNPSRADGTSDTKRGSIHT